jgi:hypothetical protein
VAEIEKQFTRLEAGVTALRRMQANLKRYRAAVLKAACEGRLVPTEAELAKAENRKSTFETGEDLLTRILTERRQIHERAQAASSRKKKYKEPTTPTIPPDEDLTCGLDVGDLGSNRLRSERSAIPERRIPRDGIQAASPRQSACRWQSRLD